MARPVIGITTYVTPAKWSYWDAEAALIPVDYVYAVERAGGRALLVPPSEDGVEETLQALDGLLFSGGSDLDPGLYDQEPHEETLGIHEARDRAELALLEAALERDMPVLAICRGSQVLNVARGGDLVQHLPEVVGDEKHKHTPGTFADHDVTLEEGTRLGSLLGDHAPVKSHHHQGIGRIGGAYGFRRTPRTGRSKRSRIQTGASPWACSGIRKPAATRGSSRSSSAKLRNIAPPARPDPRTRPPRQVSDTVTKV